MSAAHTNDPPKSNNIDASPIDPSFETNNDEAREASRSSSSSSATEIAKLPEDEQSLRKAWLSLLPTEQVIEILLKLDEALPEDAEVRQSVWPQDLKAAVFHAAVTKIVESSASTTTGNAHANGNGKAGEKKDEVKDPPVVQSAATPTTTTTETTTNQSTQSRAAITSTFATSTVPPLTNIVPRRSPPTSTTSYQAAAIASASAASSHSSPGSFYMYPFANGTIPYTHASTHQSYHIASYTSMRPPLQSTSSAGAGASNSSTNSPVLPPPPVSLSFTTPPPPTPGGPIMTEDDDDLPSYEEMLVQALTVHNDPAGTAPKQLFQWMAATYPLQANFRPSASQALQKAFKRGRFEKNSEGRYRLNPQWEGGNTSRRTTRRPQSYSKSVLNPSPSSHPPRNSAHLVPQHYAWTQHKRQQQGEVGKSQSPVPVPLAASTPTTYKLEAGMGSEAGETEDHKSCMEAAYSILQALNITTPATRVDKTVMTTTERNDSVPPIPSIGQVPDGQTVVTVDETSPSSATEARTQEQSRSALQGTLALLAAQLAEIADGVVDESASANGADVLATGSGVVWI